jgi:glucose/arabinose dehydrogenase
MPVQELMEQDQPFTNHNGGNLQFSPKDGFLYIGFGDGGSAGDPNGNGQNINTWLAKILRIDVDSGKPYGVPAGNLPGGKPEVWDYGLRNPWRYSFDLCTGDLYIGEVGQDTYEEVDVEPAGMGNKDYGWNTMEGLHCFNPKNGCKKDGLTLPVLEYDHLTGKSITGGYVYRGSKIPGLRGTYFYADYVVSKVWTFKWNGEASVTPTEITNDLNPPQALSSFGQDNYGEVYLTSLTGTIYRIESQ